MGKYPGSKLRAKRAASWLIDLAKRTEPNVLIAAQTLPEENVSAAVLRSRGFEMTGQLCVRQKESFGNRS